MPLAAGDTVLCSTAEYHANYLPLLQARASTRAPVYPHLKPSHKELGRRLRILLIFFKIIVNFRRKLNIPHLRHPPWDYSDGTLDGKMDRGQSHVWGGAADVSHPNLLILEVCAGFQPGIVLWAPPEKLSLRRWRSGPGRPSG